MGIQREIRRKIFHLVSLLIPIGYLMFDREIILKAVAIALVVVISLELARLFIPRFRNKIHPFFSPIMRVAEEKKLSGVTYMIAGAWITIYLFEKEIAIIALLLVSISDATAAIVGTAYGKIHLWQKTLEGSVAFFTVTGLMMILTGNISLEQKLVGMVSGTLVELLPIPINDNLSLPIVTALAMQTVGG